MRVLFVDISSYRFPLPPDYWSIHRLRRIASDLITEQVSGAKPPSDRLTFSRGLLLLATAMKQAGASVKYVHFQGEALSSLFDSLKATDMVCLYVMTPTARTCLRIARESKRINPKVTVCLGGPHAAAASLSLITTGYVDFVCSTEPTSLTSLVGQLFEVGRRSPTRRVELGDNHTGKNRNDVDLSDYKEYVDYSILPNPVSDYYLNLSTSRGCAYSCHYCSDGTRAIKLRDLDNLFEEISWLDGELPSGSWLHFFDTIFTVPPSRSRRILKRLAAETTKFLFSADLKANHLDKEMALLLQMANFRFLAMGFETGEASILMLSEKKNSPTECEETAHVLKSNTSRICLKAYWLFGLPGSTHASSNRDIAKIKSLLDEGIVDVVGPKFFVPYPETPYYKENTRFGLRIWTRDWSSFDRFKIPPVSTPVGMSRKALASYLVRAEKEILSCYCRRLGLSVTELAKLDLSPKRYNGELYSRLVG